MRFVVFLIIWLMTLGLRIKWYCGPVLAACCRIVHCSLLIILNRSPVWKSCKGIQSFWQNNILVRSCWSLGIYTLWPASLSITDWCWTSWKWAFIMPTGYMLLHVFRRRRSGNIWKIFYPAIFLIRHIGIWIKIWWSCFLFFCSIWCLWPLKSGWLASWSI